MNEQSHAVVLSCVVLGLILLSVVAIATVWARSGRIQRSALVNRREKNIRHLVTISTLGIGVACTAIFVLIDSRIGVYWIFGTAFFGLFIAPIRTVIIEMGLRRTSITSTGPAPPSSSAES